MRARRSGRGRRWRVAGLAGLLALGIVVAGELAARHLLPDTPASSAFVLGESRVGYLSADPHTAYALAAGYRDSVSHAGAYATGPWPGRGGPPPSGSEHAAVFGDSCTYGVGVLSSETLAARVEQGLARDGQAWARVVNWGVPGFSSEQVLARLRLVLEEQRPRTAVFYLSSWNDQSAALGDRDERVLARLRGFRAWLRRTALGRLARERLGDGGPKSRPDQVPTARKAGSTPLGGRVPHERFAANVQALLAACHDAGVESLVLLPSYPAATLAGHPRLARDRERVRQIAQAAGASVLDTRILLDAAGLSDGLAFVDYVHPSAAAHEVLGEAVAALLRERATAPERSAAPFSIRSVKPARACSLGDVPVIVGVDGLAEGELPVLLVGGAPLLDVHALGDGRFEGLLMTNEPSQHDVVVQGRQGVARRSRALELWEPHLELDESGALVVVARPGDEALVVAATGLLVEPLVEPRGTAWLDPATLTASFPDLVVGVDGQVRVPLAPDDPARWFQALITPAGAEPHAKRYSAVFDRSAAAPR